MAYIYAPRGKAGEYSPLASNPYRGCPHACEYCYVPSILRMTREDFHVKATPRKGFIAGLEKDAKKIQDKQQILLSFTCDPYPPGDSSLTRETIEVLQRNDFPVCTLTKGGNRALRDLDLFRPGVDAFAITLTTLKESNWEPQAAPPIERLDTLRAFHEAGIYTWMSIEPALSAEETIEIIQNSYRFTNLYKIGKTNYHPHGKTVDWQDYTNRITKELDMLKCRYYIKKDLQGYLSNTPS